MIWSVRARLFLRRANSRAGCCVRKSGEGARDADHPFYLIFKDDPSSRALRFQLSPIARRRFFGAVRPSSPRFREGFKARSSPALRKDPPLRGSGRPARRIEAVGNGRPDASPCFDEGDDRASRREGDK